MTAVDDETAPDWLPEASSRYWTEGELRPPRQGRWELGQVPADTEVRVRAPAANITVAAESVGPGSTLRLVGDTRAQMVAEGFAVIHLAESLPQVLTITAGVNIHLLTGGEMRLAAAGAPDATTAKVWFDDASEKPGNCKLTTAVPLTSLRGQSATAVQLHAHGDAANCPVAPGTAVKLPNCRSLAVEGSLERSDVDIAGSLVVRGALVGACDVTAGSVLLGVNAQASRWQPADDVLVEAGTTVRARKGQMAIAGRVRGMADAPVVVVGANEQEVRLGAVEHVEVKTPGGQCMGTVTIGPSAHAKVADAATIVDHAAESDVHSEPDLRAATRIQLTGPVRGGRLEADAVRVREVIGPADLLGGTVALTVSAHDDAGTVTVTAKEWVKAASSADLHITTRGPSPCRLLVGGQAGNPAHHNQAPAPPPEDLLADDVAETTRDADQTAHLALSGPLQVECAAATTIVTTADDVAQLQVGGELRMPAGGSVGQVRSRETLHLGEAGADGVELEGADVKAPSIVRSSEERGRVAVRASGRVQAGSVDVDELSCAKLDVEADATLGELVVTESTHVGGRLAAPEHRSVALEHRLNGEVELADVEVPLILDRAHGSITASEPEHEDDELTQGPAIQELTWQDPTGRLSLAHPVALLRVYSRREEAALEVSDLPSCQRVEVDGRLQMAGGVKRKDNRPSSDTSAEEADRPRILLKDAAHLSLATGHPVWIDLPEDAEVTLRAQDDRAVLHLVEDAASGRLRLAVPRSDAEGRMARLESSAAATASSQVPDQPTIVVEQGELLLAGVFADVLADDESTGHAAGVEPITIHVPAETVIHQMRGVVALGEFHGRVTGAEPGRGLLHRFTAAGSSRGRWLASASGPLGWLTGEPSVEDRLVLVDPAAGPDEENAHRDISKGVLVGADVTRLSFAELDRLEGLDVFSPDPVALERKARSRPDRAAARQSNAQHLSRVAHLLAGRSVTGSVRSMANWAASTAHAATGRGLERIGRRVARWLGYGQRPMPALVLLVTLVALTTGVLSLTGWEGAVCEGWFGDERGAKAVAAYSVVQELERVLLAPLAFLRVAGPLELQPLGCSPLVQVLGTVVVALPLAFVLIGLRNYLRSPVDR